jgi:hypothetical protein
VPDLAAAIQNFFETSTTLEALLGAVGILALLTAGVGFVLRLNQRKRKERVRAGRRSARAGMSAYEDWNVEGGIIFPSGGGGGDFRRERFDRQQFDNGRTPERESFLAEGFEGIAARGERAIEAVRERPLEFLAGALAAGFVAGVLLPVFSDRSRQARLLERLVAENEERSLLKAQREAERFRQARQK